jgi:phosphoglycerol transferase
VLAGSGGVYYAFFGCFFLLVAGATASWRERRLHPLSSSAVLVGLISLTVLANVLPFMSDRWQHGPNECAVQRLPANAEIYGLKIAQLLLPVTGHRVSALRALKDRYNDPSTPLVNENDSATLGCVAGVGFLFLIVGLLIRSRYNARDDLRHGLGVLNASAVLLGTIGGFSSLLSFLLTPWIRGYNRVSVFIAFFALTMVALVLSRLQARLATTGGRQMLCYVALVALLGLGLLDQMNRGFAHIQHEATHRAFAEDAEFIARIESQVPEGSMVLELPYLPFPECPPPRPMADYDPFRPYLHSTKLRWSFGAVKGTYADAWQQAVLYRPVKEMVAALALAGFGGIYVDRFGCDADLESLLRDRIDSPPLCSSSGRFAFYDLGPYREKLRQTCSAAEWQRRRQEALTPLLVTWPRGGELCEADGCMSWRWSRDNAICLVHNPTNQVRRASLEMTLEAAGTRSCKLRLDGPLIQEQLTVSGEPTRFTRTLVVPPGEHPIQFHCNGHPALRSRDLRLVEIHAPNE